MELKDAIDNPDAFALSGVLPQICVGDDNMTVTEVTICSSISGGKDEVNLMPRQLTLTRLKGNTLIEATYQQVK